MRLTGKVAIVTGGASGIGAATCRLFVREGARGVVIADMNEGTGQALETELTKGGWNVMFRCLDVTRESQWVETIEAVVARYGRLDVLVNNAGRGGPISRPVVEQTTEEAWDLMFAVNAKGVFLGTKHAIPAMRRAGGGSVINVVSVYAMVGSSLGTAYSASKGAARAFTRTAAMQYAAEGIRVNSVFPGFVETPMTRPMLSEKSFHDYVMGNILLGRLCKPEDLTGALIYLATKDRKLPMCAGA